MKKIKQIGGPELFTIWILAGSPIICFLLFIWFMDKALIIKIICLNIFIFILSKIACGNKE